MLNILRSISVLNASGFERSFGNLRHKFAKSPGPGAPLDFPFFFFFFFFFYEDALFP